MAAHACIYSWTPDTDEGSLIMHAIVRFPGCPVEVRIPSGEVHVTTRAALELVGLSCARPPGSSLVCLFRTGFSGGHLQATITRDDMTSLTRTWPVHCVMNKTNVRSMRTATTWVWLILGGAGDVRVAASSTQTSPPLSPANAADDTITMA
jgi:hypothetical protein